MAQYDDIEILGVRAAEDLLGAEVLLDSDHEFPALVGFHLQRVTRSRKEECET